MMWCDPKMLWLIDQFQLGKPCKKILVSDKQIRKNSECAINQNHRMQSSFWGTTDFLELEKVSYASSSVLIM